MTQEQMREEIAELTERALRPDPRRQFEIIRIFEDKWKARILFELLEQSPLRFVDLLREVPGISNGVLANTLKSLEKQGLVTRESFRETPPRVEYTITERGSAMQPLFLEMLRWEVNYSTEI